MNLNISGYSTALFATWYFVEELGLLFDAGDGISAHLMAKSRKIKHVFVSHADRDHVMGLFQLNQLNAREEYPKIYYPEDSGSFKFMEEFSRQFDEHVAQTQWFPLAEGEAVRVKKDVEVANIRNGHIKKPGNPLKSLSFIVQQVKCKLKPEFAGLPGAEIATLRLEKGEAAIMDEVRAKVLGYSADTPVEDLDRWQDVRTLIHEATFLDKNDTSDFETRGAKHSVLGDVMKMVSESNVQRLILGHFSTRYSAAQIDAEIMKYCREFRVEIPVFRVLPGQFERDILSGTPVNHAK